MSRISTQPPATLRNRTVAWYSRRRFGAALAPGLVMGHNPGVLKAYVALERGLERARHLDPRLEMLAVMTSAARLGCAWCMDFGYWAAREGGLDDATLADVASWRDSARFTPLERRVMEYAETMSDDARDVTDAQVRELVDALGDAAAVELTMMIAVENMRSRFNLAMGLTSQGFRDRCDAPVPRTADA